MERGTFFFISGILLPRIFLGSLPIQLHDYKRTFPRPKAIHNGPLCALLGFTDISLMAPWPKGPTFTGLPLREWWCGAFVCFMPWSSSSEVRGTSGVLRAHLAFWSFRGPLAALWSTFLSRGPSMSAFVSRSFRFEGSCANLKVYVCGQQLKTG